MAHDCGPVPGKCRDWHEHALEVERGLRPAGGVFKITGASSATDNEPEEVPC